MALRLLVTAHSDAQARSFRYDFDDDRAQILLGRRGGVDVLLPHAGVSLVHARIERRAPGQYALVDDQSTNGTSLNGARLEPGVERPLRQGDRIAIAEFVLEVAEVDADGDGHPSESSLSMARRMVQDVLGVLGPGEQQPTLTVVESAPAADGRPPPQLALDRPGVARIVGRDPTCDLVLDEESVAPRHLRVVRGERGEVIASDLGSPFGLYVNERFVAGERVLVEGDVLAVGRVRLRFDDPAELYLRRLEQAPAPGERTPRSVGGVPESGAAVGGGSGVALPPRSSAPARVGLRPIERAIFVGAAALAVAAAAGLLYLWLP